MNKTILSTEYPQFADRLQAIGYQIIPSEEIPCQMPYERRHADLQCLFVNDAAFVLSRCTGLIQALSEECHVIPCGAGFSGKYPDNICLNALWLGDKLICRVDSLDQAIRNYCEEQGIELIDVKQGYAKCSCAVISENAIITADKSILRALDEKNIDVLQIGQGSVTLSGADYGFLGGATGYDREKKTLYCCGNLSRHPDADKIRSFCNEHGTEIICLSDDELTDIGGILIC